MKKKLILGIIFLLPLSLVFFLNSGETKFKPLDIYYDLRNPEFDPSFLTAKNCPPNFVDSIWRVRDFALKDQNNRDFSLKNVEGKIFVANFILTRCTNSICPTMVAELVRVQEAFANPEYDIHLLSFSIDPEYDSPEILRQYATTYRANGDYWHFLTGDKAEIYQQAHCSYFVAAQSQGDYSTIDHADKLILVDKERRIRGYYSGTSRQEVDRLITEIQLLLKEYQR
jgi:protein SCO1/2